MKIQYLDDFFEINNIYYLNNHEKYCIINKKHKGAYNETLRYDPAFQGYSRIKR